jgi:hypothetical protein
MGERRGLSEAMRKLPLKAMYTIGQLATAASMDRRALKIVLEENEVRFVRSGRWWFVSVSELERKVPPLWEGIKVLAELRQVASDT